MKNIGIKNIDIRVIDRRESVGKTGQKILKIKTVKVKVSNASLMEN